MIVDLVTATLCAGCGMPMHADTQETCVECDVSIYAPWYVDLRSEILTRCMTCQAVIDVNTDLCPICSTPMDEPYWTQWNVRYAVDGLLHAPFARMLCCNSMYLRCDCDPPINPAVFMALAAWPFVDDVYDDKSDCRDCLFSYGPQCQPLDEEITRAAEHIRMSPESEFIPIALITCEHFEPIPDMPQ